MELVEGASQQIARRGARQDPDARVLAVGPVLRRPGLLVAAVSGGGRGALVFWVREAGEWQLAHEELRVVVD